MFLNLLKRALKTVLHDATDEWAVEFGLPKEVVNDLRSQRLAREAQLEAEADNRAAAALGIDDEEIPAPAMLIMHSAAQVTFEEPQQQDAQDTQPAVDDATVAGSHGVHEEEQLSPLGLPMPVAAQVTSPDTCPAPCAGEDALLNWVRRQREKNVSWAELTRQAKKGGHVIGDGALRKLYQRAKDQVGQTS